MLFLRKFLGYNLVLPPLKDTKQTRRARLVDLLMQCSRHVPFYEGTFDYFLSTSKDLSDEEFFYSYSHLPIVTKQDLKTKNNSFRHERLKDKVALSNDGETPAVLSALKHGLIQKDFCISLSTGGSSGVPAFRWLDYDDAQAFAHSFLHSFQLNGWSPGERFVVYYPLKSYFTSSYADHASALNMVLGFTMVPFETVTKESVEQLLHTLKKRKASLLVIFPCVLQRVAEIMKAENMPPFEGLSYINVSGEYLLDCSKKYIQSMFPDSDIQSTYGAVEFGEIAHQSGLCSTDYSVFDDYVYMEQGPDNTILVTALRQTAFPLVRYKIEDMGRVINEADGRQSLHNLEGKNTDFVVGADGHHYYASFFNSVINEINKAFDDTVIHFMLRHDRKHLEINFVLKDMERASSIEEAMLDTMGKVFSHIPSISVQFHDHFDHDYTRKFKIVAEGDGLSEVVGGYYHRKAS